MTTSGRRGGRASDKAGARDMAMASSDGGPGSGPMGRGKKMKSEAALRAGIAKWEAEFKAIKAALPPGAPWSARMEELADEIDFNKQELGE